MQVSDTNVQRKTINMSPAEVKKALKKYLEDRDHHEKYSYLGKEGEEEKQGPIFLDKNTKVAFNSEGGAKITTEYGG